MFDIRPAKPEHAAELAPRLRPADLREIVAACGQAPEQVLRDGIEWSDPCFAVRSQSGRLIALFGAGPDRRRAGAGLVWLLAAEDLVRTPFAFLRLCRAWVERLHESYPVLGNFVDARNEAHLRWLRWCDFTLLGTIPEHGVERRPFIEFTRARNNVNHPDEARHVLPTD